MAKKILMAILLLAMMVTGAMSEEYRSTRAAEAAAEIRVIGRW